MIHHDDDATNDKALSDQANALIKIHKSFKNENSVFEEPSSGFQHILLLYNNNDDLNLTLSRYLNAGLLRDELCIHASVDLLNQNYIKNFTSNIDDYPHHRENGNFIMLNLQQYYNKAIKGNLKDFDKLSKLVLDITTKNRKDRVNKQLRITMDCGSLLFKNGYIEQSIELETWLHQKPFAGSSLCLYPKSLFKEFPNDIYYSTLYQIHNVVVDTKGRRHTQDMNLERYKQ